MNIEAQQKKSTKQISVDIPEDVIQLMVYNNNGKLIKNEFVIGISKAQIKFKHQGCYFLHFCYANKIFIKDLEAI